MSFFDNNYLSVKEKINKYAKSALDFFEKIGNNEACETIRNRLTTLDNLRFKITIVGSLKRGKSTLLNTLMERADDNISPVDEDVCTSAIVKYMDKSLLENNSKEIAKIYFEKDEPKEVSFEEIKNFIVEKNNPKNKKEVKTVEVYGDFPQWSKAVTIIDSPGQNSTYYYHDILLKEHLPSTDAIVFLVASDIPLDQGDKHLLTKLDENQKNKIFFVLTKVDVIDDKKNLDTTSDYVNKKNEEYLTNLKDKKLYLISAKRVFEAYKNHESKERIEKLKEENGIKELEDDLEKFIIKESDKSKVFVERCKGIVDSIKKYLIEFNSSKSNLLPQKESDDEIKSSQKQALENENKKINNEFDEKRKKYDKKCENALIKYKESIKENFNNICKIIKDEINSSSFFKSIKNSFDLYGYFKDDFENNFNLNDNTYLRELKTDINKSEIDLFDNYETNIDLDYDYDYGKLFIFKDNASLKRGICCCSAYSFTLIGGITASFFAIRSANNSLSILSEAIDKKNEFENANWFKKGWNNLFYSTEIKEAQDGVINAQTLANKATLIAVGVVIFSLIIVFVVRKICHYCLKKQQKDTIEKFKNDLYNNFVKETKSSLENYKGEFLKEQEQLINKKLDENKNTIKEIENELKEIEVIRQEFNEAKTLIESSHVLSSHFLNLVN